IQREIRSLSDQWCWQHGWPAATCGLHSSVHLAFPNPDSTGMIKARNETHSQMSSRSRMAIQQRSTTREFAGQSFRPTAQRALVHEVVTSADKHLTAAEIFERVRQRDP